ncbi:hypothetical protein IFM89_023993 [Coptis chinensis]|uniref:Uncharacterized protein n=1 Tax=Coptis chinensis TaxID=261450 RepID=A0A835LG59_9MAGN|nr:hypothetical protein IFM89_023993 [Coptis chinensis]
MDFSSTEFEKEELNLEELLSKGTTTNYDLNVLQKMNSRPPKCPTIKQCKWFPPVLSFLKLNTDGAAKGNP